MNRGQAHCLALQTRFVIRNHQKLEVCNSGIVQSFKILISILSFTSSLYFKIAPQGKQMRVGAREACAYPSTQLALRANGNGHEVDSNTFL
jgi:hypothetical protein